MLTSVWGPAMWRSLHAITFAYPEHASAAQQREAVALFTSLQSLLPCEDCLRHYTRELQAHPVERAVGGRDALSRWLVDLHNRVNARLGKPHVDYDAVLASFAGSACPAAAAAPASAACLAGQLTPGRGASSEGASGERASGEGASANGKGVAALPGWLQGVLLVLLAVLVVAVVAGVAAAAARAGSSRVGGARVGPVRVV